MLQAGCRGSGGQPAAHAPPVVPFPLPSGSGCGPRQNHPQAHSAHPGAREPVPVTFSCLFSGRDHQAAL